MAHFLQCISFLVPLQKDVVMFTILSHYFSMPRYKSTTYTDHWAMYSLKMLQPSWGSNHSTWRSWAFTTWPLRYTALSTSQVRGGYSTPQESGSLYQPRPTLLLVEVVYMIPAYHLQKGHASMCTLVTLMGYCLHNLPPWVLLYSFFFSHLHTYRLWQHKLRKRNDESL